MLRTSAYRIYTRPTTAITLIPTLFISIRIKCLTNFRNAVIAFMLERRKLIPVGAGRTLVTHRGFPRQRPVLPHRILQWQLTLTKLLPHATINVPDNRITANLALAQETPYSRSQARSETGIPLAHRTVVKPHQERYSTHIHTQAQDTSRGPTGGLLSGVLWVGGFVGGNPHQQERTETSCPA
ncbi:gp8 [Haloarcula hispanica pleomorphic virus 2]|uniref:Gp8 n=1 Tax=Haloarcula hispanica pleomorphic virus 2 TaxID=1442594 RepID=W0FJS3_9VIRU|nr:gp8 [Haloarcula hispanica pleomorphic virus 2]AHF22120.1 gp8 [Haloarcula hispanica pleomorphic virus 2]